MNNTAKRKANPFEEPELNLTSFCSDKYYYLIMFFAGLAFLLIGSIFYILPILSFSGAIKNLSDINFIIDILYTYNGFLGSTAEVVGISLAVIFLRKVFVNDYFRFKKDWKKNLIIIVIACLLLLALDYLFSWIYEIGNISDTSENQEIIEKSLSGNGKWAMILQTALIAPIFEELVFRKTIFGYLNKTNLPRAVVVIIVTMLFALVHMSSDNFMDWKTYVFLANYFALALVLVYAYRLTNGNIYASIMVHMFNNIYALLVTFGVLNVFVH